MIRIKRNNSFIVFLVVLGLLIFLHSFGVLRPLENFLLFLTKPISSQLYHRGTSFNFSYKEQQETESLLAKINDLTQEVERLTVANSGWRETREENEKLRQLFEFSSGNQLKTVLAQIIAKETLSDVNDEERDIILNKGENDGLEVGLAIVSENGAIVGKIVSLKKTTARACLVTSSGCRLAAAIQNQDQTIGLTDGDLGLTVKMNYIPQSETINIDDIAITSGLGEKIPRGLAIGKITMVKSESNEVWQSATIDPLVNFNNLTLVSVILP